VTVESTEVGWSSEVSSLLRRSRESPRDQAWRAPSIGLEVGLLPASRMLALRDTY